MAQAIPGWTAELERAFKEILFRFLEEVQSTKAALYLLAPDGAYALVSQYGFGRRDELVAELHPGDTIVLLAREQRVEPRAFNHPRELPELAGYLEGAGTARMLLVPLYAESRLFGFVDARDKARKQPFEKPDLGTASAIAGRLLELVARVGLYPGLEAPPPEPAASQRLEVGRSRGGASAELVLDPEGLALVQREASELCRRDAAAAVALTVVDLDTVSTVVWSRLEEGELDRGALQRHQAEALRAAGGTVPEGIEWRIDPRPLTPPRAITRGLQIASARLVGSGGSAVVASVVGEIGGRGPEEALERLCAVAETACSLAGLGYVRRRAAWAIVHPPGRRYPELQTHSVAVSRLSWAMAGRIGLAVEEREAAALAGLLHDIGMRDLDYDELYRHPNPGPDERAQYQKHPLLGEEIVCDGGFAELAPAVRHHHERWDGKGYPDRLAGEAIPLLARLVHVAEVFDVLTSKTSYRAAVDDEHALSLMEASAGQQLDSELVRALARTIE